MCQKLTDTRGLNYYTSRVSMKKSGASGRNPVGARSPQSCKPFSLECRAKIAHDHANGSCVYRVYDTRFEEDA